MARRAFSQWRAILFPPVNANKRPKCPINFSPLRLTGGAVQRTSQVGRAIFPQNRNVVDPRPHVGQCRPSSDKVCNWSSKLCTRPLISFLRNYFQSKGAVSSFVLPMSTEIHLQLSRIFVNDSHKREIMKGFNAWKNWGNLCGSTDANDMQMSSLIMHASSRRRSTAGRPI